MVMHRSLQGTPKSAIVKRTPTGKWFVSICCEAVPEPVVPESDTEVGIDVGLKTFAYLSDGTTIENPARAEEKNLAKAQRKRDKAPKNRQNEKNSISGVPVSMSAQRTAEKTLLTRRATRSSSSMG